MGWSATPSFSRSSWRVFETQSREPAGQAGRQVMFIAVSVFGWVQWHRSRGASQEAVTRSRPAPPAPVLVAALLSALPSARPSSAPWVVRPVWADAWIFMGSLLAAWGSARAGSSSRLSGWRWTSVGVPCCFSAGSASGIVTWSTAAHPGRLLRVVARRRASARRPPSAPGTGPAPLVGTTGRDGRPDLRRRDRCVRRRQTPGSRARVTARQAPPAASDRGRPMPERITAATAAITALTARRAGCGRRSPVVGAALLSAEGEVLHVGYRRGAGTHAPRSSSWTPYGRRPLRDAHLLVTLEPCHHGPHGPSADHPACRSRPGRARRGRHHGRGARRCRVVAEHGVEVQGRAARRRGPRPERSLAARPAAAPPFRESQDHSEHRRPRGRHGGTSQSITGAPARAEGRRLRTRVDAVLVGGGTLAQRRPLAHGAHPRRRALAGSPLARGDVARPVPRAARIRGADGRFVQLDAHDPREALTRLRDREAAHVLVEGGPTVAAAFLAADLVDELSAVPGTPAAGAGTSS
ncbi:dihydrofolate reductase family protein [Kocuria rhizophila]|nr:dihydrofolate reductase family protein [Kocuria rhizophila]